MNDQDARVDEFAAELDKLKLKGAGQAQLESRLQTGGIVLVVVGLVLIIIGFNGAAGTSFTPEAISYLISGGILGLSLVIVGTGLFIRYSVSDFMKFWMLRMIHEQKTQAALTRESTDRVTAAIHEATEPIEMPLVENQI